MEITKNILNTVKLTDDTLYDLLYDLLFFNALGINSAVSSGCDISEVWLVLIDK